MYHGGNENETAETRLQALGQFLKSPWSKSWICPLSVVTDYCVGSWSYCQFSMILLPVFHYPIALGIGERLCESSEVPVQEQKEKVGLGSGNSPKTPSNYTSCGWVSLFCEQGRKIIMAYLQRHPDEWHHNLTLCMEWTKTINLWFCYISYCQVVFSLAGPWINPAGSANWILVTFKIPVTEIISILMGIEVFTVMAVMEPKLCPEVDWRGEKSLRGHSARVTARNAQSFVLSEFVFWAQARSDSGRHMRYWEDRGWWSYGNIPHQAVSQSEAKLSPIQTALKCFAFSSRSVGSPSFTFPWAHHHR